MISVPQSETFCDLLQILELNVLRHVKRLQDSEQNPNDVCASVALSLSRSIENDIAIAKNKNVSDGEENSSLAIGIGLTVLSFPPSPSLLPPP